MIFDANALKAAIEEGREVGEPTSMYLSVTGEEYVVIGSQAHSAPLEPGTVDQGQDMEWSFDAETAYFMALACFKTYAHGKTGKLYWRRPPELVEVNNLTRKYPRKMFFYMRCLISDKPPIWEQATAEA